MTTHEEQIDLVKRLIATGISDEAREVLEKQFPELKESDDERIGNLIYCIVRDREDVRDTLEANGVSVDDALTYLEKQKEQKPVHTAKEMWKEMRLEVYAQASGNRHEPNYSDDSTKMFSLCDIDEIFEKIGNSTVESRPVGWSNLDMDILGDAITATDMLGNDEKYKKSNPNLAKAFRVAKDWLKSLPERFNLQLKQEWSEEDEAKKERLISIVKRALHGNEYPLLNDNGATELITWLKSLRPQPKAEWTIKDAKPGDILTTGKVTFIFKSVDKRGLHLTLFYTYLKQWRRNNYESTRSRYNIY